MLLPSSSSLSPLRERERKIHTHTPSHYSNTGDERKTAISEPQSQADQLQTPRGGRHAPQSARRGVGNGGGGSGGGREEGEKRQQRQQFE